MKKLSAFVLLVGLALGGMLRPAHAWIFQEIPDKAVTVHYRLPVAAATSTTTLMVSLSSTTWPHSDRGYLNLDAVKLDIDKVSTSSGTIKIGVVTAVNSSSGCVNWIWSREYSKNVSNTGVTGFASYLPAYVNCKVIAGANSDTPGTTPYIIANDSTTWSTTFQTDVTLPTPTSFSWAPGLGDLVLSVVNSDGGNSVVITIDALYHGNQR
jgi:hypothetical protein